MDEDIMNDKFDLLDVMHHYTSGFKSVLSQNVFENGDICRQSLGGVGISLHSMIPVMVQDYAPVVQFEGDNTVMAKQNVSYIQKLVKRVGKGKPAEGYFGYLNSIEELVTSKSKA